MAKQAVSYLNSPIKIVENSKTAKYKQKYLNSVVNGKGNSAATGAVPLSYEENKEGLPIKVWWQTLLDSGSDGDLLFITKKQLKNIPCLLYTSPSPRDQA